MAEITDNPAYEYEEGSCSAYVAFIDPYCTVHHDNEQPFELTLDQVNSNEYDHGRLCRIVCSVPVGSGDLEALVCGDGAIAIPFSSQYGTRHDVLDLINRFFCCLVLGGLECEAVDSRDIVIGTVNERGSVWPTGFGRSLSADSHSCLRMKIAGSIHRIILHNPKSISVSRLKHIYTKGDTVLSKVPGVSPSLLLRGRTETTYDNLVEAHTSMWTVAEQLIDTLWRDQFIPNSSRHLTADLKARSQSLKDDSRTWTTSVKLELLLQSGFIAPEIFALLFPARQARNALVHSGKTPPERIVGGLYNAVVDLLEAICRVQLSDFRKLPDKGHLIRSAQTQQSDILWRAVTTNITRRGSL